MRTAHVDLTGDGGSYSGVEALLYRQDGRWVPGRKVARNTYLERRGELQGIALKLHTTDILLWRDDNTVTLNTGGWLTTTTKARMNDWLPRERGSGRRCEIWSDRGYWQVRFTTLDHDLKDLVSVAYHDNMVVDLANLTEFSPTYDDHEDREWNTTIDRLVVEWMKEYDKLVVETGTTRYNNAMQDLPSGREEIVRTLLYILGSTGLANNAHERQFPAWLVSLVRQTGIRSNVSMYTQANLSESVTRLLKDDLRKLFRGYLYRGYHSRILK